MSRGNITNHVPIAGGAGERGHQPADAPSQQVKILFYSFEQKIYLTCYKKIFQELAAAAPAQLQRVRVHTEAGACPAGARGRVHVQTSRWVRRRIITWRRDDMMGQDVLVKRQIYSLYFNVKGTLCILVKRQSQGCVLAERQRNPFCKIHPHLFVTSTFPYRRFAWRWHNLGVLLCCCFRHWEHLGHKTLLQEDKRCSLCLSLQLLFFLILQEP